MTKRAFIGIKNKTYTLKIRVDETRKIISYGSKTLNTSDRYEITLIALYECVKNADYGDTIFFYANDDLMSFQWETEWKKEKHLPPKTKLIELWDVVILETSIKNIDLTIKGENSALSAYGRLLNEFNK